MISIHDWSIKNELGENGQVCVHVHINDSVELTNIHFSLLDSERKIIVCIKQVPNEIYLCVSLAHPMFAQLGDCVRYVDGSGVDDYKIKEKDISIHFKYSGEAGSAEEIKKDWGIDCELEEDNYITLYGGAEMIKEFLEDYSLSHLFDFDDPAFEDQKYVYFVSHIKEEP